MIEKITLQNVKSNDVLELDTIDTPNYILGSVDWGTVEGTHHSYRFVNQNGVSVFGINLGTRTILIQGWVLADNETLMNDKKRFLNKFFNPQQEIVLTYKDYELNFYPTSSIKYANSYSENNELMCKFKIEGLCPNPLFKKKKETKSEGASLKSMFKFPLIITDEKNSEHRIIFGERDASLIIPINNEGSVDTGIIIVFKARGNLKNPKLININTLEFFKINKEMKAGEEIIINTSIGEKKVQGFIDGQVLNYFKYIDLDSDWLKLKVGDNLFKYETESNLDNLEVRIYFNAKYLEVQECD